MKLNRMIGILFLCATIGYSETFDGVSFRISPKTPRKFYEGQVINLEYIVENTTNEVKKYSIYHLAPHIRYIKNLDKDTIVNKEKYFNDMYENGVYTVQSDYPRMKPFFIKEDVIELYSKQDGVFNRMADLIKENGLVPDSTFAYPSLFKPGKYEIMISLVMRPSKDTMVNLYYQFEIETIPKKYKAQQIEFLNAINELAINRYNEDHFLKMYDNPNSLFNLIRTKPDHIYAGTMFWYCMSGSFLPKSSMRIKNYSIKEEVSKNPENVFKLLESFRKIIKYDINAPCGRILDNGSNWIRECNKLGIIPNMPIYLDQVLKDLENYNCSRVGLALYYYNKVSDNSLKNYSKERLIKNRQ